jgi:hypothetical protein
MQLRDSLFGQKTVWQVLDINIQHSLPGVVTGFDVI